MKKLLIFLCLMFSIEQFAQQDKFIIGVDWINPTSPHPYGEHYLLSNNYWNLLESFGVNFGALNIGMGQPSGVNKINTELTQAYERDITIFLETYDGIGGRRWMYQVEGTLDFNTHHPEVGEDGRDGNNLTGAEPHWSLLNVEEDPIDYWNLNTLDHIPGIASEDLITDDEIPDGANYYVRLRLRKTEILNDPMPVVKVIIINKSTGGTVGEKIITANELNQNEWTEKYLLVFYKSANSPYNYVEGADNIMLNDSLGMAGVEDYTLTTDVFTPYEIKIEWFGDVNCDLDYIVIEDFESYKLHNGYYDDDFNQIVSEFGNHPGLGKIKVWDEPRKENLLPVRYMKKEIDELLSGTGNEHKGALTFNNNAPPVYPGPQRYLAQT